MVLHSLLDINKDCDTVKCYKLMYSLMKVDVLKCLVAMLKIWYSNLEIVVRWSISLSNTLLVRSGVRHCSILIPSLFILSINLIIVNLKNLTLIALLIERILVVVRFNYFIRVSM